VATSTTNAAAALGDITRFAEMRKRLLFLLGALVVYRIGTFIPVPGIDAAKFAAFFSTQNGTLLGMFNMFSGGALQRFSIFALNVMPYITASIIVQMASMVYPPWNQIRKDGESGRRKLMQFTRYGTVGLAAFQGFGAALAIQNSGSNLVPNPGPQFLFVATISITTGTLFVMWLGEQITERGIGNGITMIIVAGIIAGLPRAIGNTLDMVRTGEMNPLIVLLILVVVVLVTLFCVFVERALRKIQVNYAKRQVGRRMMQGQSTHLPFKLNMAGVIPPIFASSLLVFPATIAQFFGNSPNPNVIQRTLQKIAAILNYGQPLHVVLFGLLVIGFAFFYVALVYDARDTAENLKKAGAFIPGQEGRRLHSRDPSGPADGRVFGQGFDPPDAVGRPVHHGRVLAARNHSHGESGYSVSVRRHLAADHRGRCHGFRRAAAVSHDVAAIRGPDEKGQPSGHWS